MIIRSIVDRSEIDFLVSHSAKRDASARWVNGVLERGESSLKWCRMALSDGGQLLAAQVMDSWSPDDAPADTPTFVQLLGHTDEQAAVALLENDLHEFGTARVDVRLVLDGDAPPELRILREDQQRVLALSGFTVDLDRVRLEWSGSALPTPAKRLTFRPAWTLARDRLVDMFAAVGDGAVDHGMVTDRAKFGRTEEAEVRLARLTRRTYEDDWFVVGVDADGLLIGYVQSALATGDNQAILAEIGVVNSQRGHRYVDDLLSYGTGVLAGRGETRIRAYTDAGNHAMRAAFARGGYAETGFRRDFHRSANAPTPA
jgi:RimJ/RimL family protein N-acetyltransferase